MGAKCGERKLKGLAAGNRNERIEVRKVAGVTRLDCIRNDEIRHKLQQILVYTSLELLYMKHLYASLNTSNLSYILIFCAPL